MTDEALESLPTEAPEAPEATGSPPTQGHQTNEAGQDSLDTQHSDSGTQSEDSQPPTETQAAGAPEKSKDDYVRDALQKLKDEKPESRRQPNVSSESDEKSEEKPTESSASEPGEQEPDEYKMPEGLGDRQQTRFRKLVDLNKEKDAQIADISGRYQQVTEAITSTGANAEEIGQLLGYARAIKSGDRGQLEQAYQLITREQAQLAKILGHSTTDYDPLEEFPDLKQKVDDMAIDRDSALELARTRKQQAYDQAQAEQIQAVQNQEYAYHQEIEYNRNVLNNLGEQLQQQDPDFQAKMSAITPTLEQVVQYARPSEWGDLFVRLYRNAQPANSGRGNGDARPSSRTQPLTGGASSSGAGAPQSLEEAIKAGLRKAAG